MSAVNPDPKNPTTKPQHPVQPTRQAGPTGNTSGNAGGNTSETTIGKKPTSQPEAGKKASKKGSASKKTVGDSDWNVFRTVVVLVGLVLAGFGAYYLILGTAGLPDTQGQPVNPTLENQFRFFSAMMVGVGAAFVTIAVKFEWANMLWLVCLMVFVGGIGRVLSWAFSGTPHYLMIILMVIELAFPAALLVWHRYIAKTSQMRRDYDARS